MIEPIAQVLDKLNNDDMYYGEFGKRYLSNSDIIYLLKNPTQFRVEKLKTKPMVEGSYFHALMIEPHKLDEFKIIDVSSRSTKAYKEACPKDDIMLLKHEAEYIEELSSTMKRNLEMYDFIYADGNEYEVPGVDQVMGNWWKGKADIIICLC